MTECEFLLRQRDLFETGALVDVNAIPQCRPAARGGYYDWVADEWRPVVAHEGGLAYVSPWGTVVPFPWE